MFERVLRHFGWYRASDFRRSMETRSKRVLHAGVTGCMVLAPWENWTDFGLYYKDESDGRYYKIEKDKTMEPDDIVLGKKYKDRITGYEGICVGKYQYMNGCTRIGLKATTLNEGKPIDEHTFDFQDLEYVDEGITVKVQATAAAASKDPGGPRDIPKTPWK